MGACEFEAKTLKEIEDKIDKSFKQKKKKFKPFEALINSYRDGFKKVKITSITKINYGRDLRGRMSDNRTEWEFYKVETFKRLERLTKLKEKIENAIYEYSEKNRITVKDIAKEMGYTDEDLKNL